MVVKENDLITLDIARNIENMGLEKIQVRSPMTCDAPLGVCALCYGMDLSTGALVEEGMAVGIIAAQSIGEPGTQLTMRTFHIGGTAARHVEESEIKAKKQGVVKFTRMKVVRNDAGQHVVLTRNGEMRHPGPQGPRTGQIRRAPPAPTWRSSENQEVMPGTLLCQWDPHASPSSPRSAAKSASRTSSKARRCDLEKDPSGHERRLDHRSTRAICTRRSSSRMRRERSSRSTTCRNKAQHRGRGRHDGLRRHAAGQDAP